MVIAGCGGGGGGGDGAQDPKPPQVLAVFPESNTTDVAEDTLVRAVFSEEIDFPNPAEAFRLEDDHGRSEPGTLVFDSASVTAVFTSAGLLAPDTRYTAILSQGVRDLAGHPLAGEYRWSFTTGPAPTVTANLPAAGETAVAVDTEILVTFSEEIAPATLTLRVLRQFDLAPQSGTLLYDPATRTGTFTPDAPLFVFTAYLVTVDAAVTDLAGNPLKADHTWQFETEPASPPPPF
ncbi:Ig-like domain-containing protein [Desulfuromonas versatilis]|nr:Ig-like domain-containing protein [Desulfuromonas versatilis]